MSVQIRLSIELVFLSPELKNWEMLDISVIY